MKNLIVFLLISVAVLCTNAFATQISAVDDFNVFSSHMTGMKVTAELSGGTTEELFWSEYATGIYGVQGSGWSLSITPDSSTFSADWVLDTTSATIDKLTIDGIGSDILFDIILDSSNEYTANSEHGIWTGNIVGGNRWADTRTDSHGFEALYEWTFLDIIYTYGNPPGEGDLWGVFEMDFNNGNTLQGFNGRDLRFLLDTDKIDPDAVPEPATMILFGFGLLGIGALGRRRA